MEEEGGDGKHGEGVSRSPVPNKMQLKTNVHMNSNYGALTILISKAAFYTGAMK